MFPYYLLMLFLMFDQKMIHPSGQSYYFSCYTSYIILIYLNVGFLFLTLSKTTDSWSLQAISKEVKEKGRMAAFFTVALKRNLVTLYFMILGFFYLTGRILVINIIGGIGMLVSSFITLF
jgi:hypothetical protein